MSVMTVNTNFNRGDTQNVKENFCFSPCVIDDVQYVWMRKKR